MKKYTVGLLVVAVPLSAIAQVVCALGPGAASFKPYENQRPSGDALQLAERVNTAVKAICTPNCPAVALFRNTTAPNAVLTLDGGEGKLAYSPQFFATVYQGFGDAGVIGIIAHEMGHALDDAMGASWIRGDWTPELRADGWAGCILAKSRFNPADLQAALAALAKYPAPAHPAWSLRLPAIRDGYTHCGGEAASFDSGKSKGKPK